MAVFPKKDFFLRHPVLSIVFKPSDVHTAQQKPNIVLILADDLGWNDVSWHNSDMVTPHMATLAREGVILDQSYVQPTCTPTRNVTNIETPGTWTLRHRVIS